MKGVMKSKTIKKCSNNSKSKLIKAADNKQEVAVRYPPTSSQVDGVLDKEPSKSPWKRNPTVIPLQLNSAQKKRTPKSLAPWFGSS
jgi:hypothetical protein